MSEDDTTESEEGTEEGVDIPYASSDVAPDVAAALGLLLEAPEGGTSTAAPGVAYNNTSFKLNIKGNTYVDPESEEYKYDSDTVDITTEKSGVGGVKVVNSESNNTFISSVNGRTLPNKFTEIGTYTITAKPGNVFVTTPRIKITSEDVKNYIIDKPIKIHEDDKLKSISYKVNYISGVNTIVRGIDNDSIDIEYYTQPASKPEDEIEKAWPFDGVEYIKIDGKTGNIKPISSGGGIKTINISGRPGTTFNLTAKDSKDCSILEEELTHASIPETGVYPVRVNFPTLQTVAGVRTTEETYTIKVETGKPSRYLTETKGEVKISQYADPTITFTKTSSQTSPALSVSGSDVTKKGIAKTASRDIRGYTTTTQTFTITEDPDDTAGSLYVSKDIVYANNVTSSTAIKKIVYRDTDDDASIRTVQLKPGTSDDGEVKVGMTVSGKSSYTKTMMARIDATDCNTATDKFKLTNTSDLVVGMNVSGAGINTFPCTLTSIDSITDVTISSKEVILKSTVLTFEKEFENVVAKIIDTLNSSGYNVVELHREDNLPNNLELTFDDNEAQIRGSATTSGSGSNSITLTIVLDVKEFGKKDATYTLALDNFITTTPNAYDQDVVVKKDSTGAVIRMIKDDWDENATSKTGTVVKSASHGTVSAYTTSTDSFTYTPFTSYVGEDYFTFTMSDGTNTSDEKTVRIVVKQ